MKNEAFQNSSRLSDKQTKNEIQKFFDKVKQQAEIERENARHRSPFLRVLQILLLLASLSAVGTMIYGYYNFPSAPIRQTDSGFVDKIGKPHTEAAFESFKTWEKTLLITFSSAFALGFIFAFADSRQRRKNKAN